MSKDHDALRFRKLGRGTGLLRAGSGRNRLRGRMIWFPHAGGTSAAVVRQTRALPLAMETWVAVLPGREERWNESAHDLDSLVDEFHEALLDEAEQPIVLAGHSFGGLIAYLVARRRCQLDRPTCALMPMAMSAPDRLEAGVWSGVGDRELVEYLDRRYGAVPVRLQRDQEALQRYLPVVRHDLRLLESYEHQPTEPLPVDVLAGRGSEDTAVDEQAIAGWKRFTQRRFATRVFQGDHFFPYRHFAELTQLAADHLVLRSD